MRVAWFFGVVAVVAPMAAGSVFFASTQSSVRRFGEGQGGAWNLPFSSVDGLDIDDQGDLYAISWSGQFGRVNPASGVVTSLPLVPRPGFSGFYKDLAWDPVANELLGVHLGTVPGGTGFRLLTIDRAGGQATELGVISGITVQFPHRAGLAVTATGQRVLQVNEVLYTLNGVHATALPFTLGPVGMDYAGIGIDHATTGPLYYLSPLGLRSIDLTTGEVQSLGVMNEYTDIAVIPGPGAVGLVLGVALSRRRRGYTARTL